ncbi:MAG: hypothetical protein QXP32_09405, partial [Nitrososphaeria archaeon]
MSDFDAIKIADALKPSSLSKTARRNRLIKKVLSEVFGQKNVRVRGRHGWVEIEIIVKKNHECNYFCPLCSDEKNTVRKKVWDILEKTGLINELGKYYNDMNELRYECL